MLRVKKPSCKCRNSHNKDKLVSQPSHIKLWWESLCMERWFCIERGHTHCEENCYRLHVYADKHHSICRHLVNSLAPGGFERNLRKVIFKLILMIGGWGVFCKIALRWMSMDLTDDKSILVQVMAWCRQPTNHYLSQCWPRSMSPYGVTRPLAQCMQNGLHMD